MLNIRRRPTKQLEQRRDFLLFQNRQYLAWGDWKLYRRNCLRIAMIATELNRRSREEVV